MKVEHDVDHLTLGCTNIALMGRFSDFCEFLLPPSRDGLKEHREDMSRRLRWMGGCLAVVGFAVLLRLCTGLHPYSGNAFPKPFQYLQIPEVATRIQCHLYLCCVASHQECKRLHDSATTRPSVTGWRSPFTCLPLSGTPTRLSTTWIGGASTTRRSPPTRATCTLSSSTPCVRKQSP